MVTHIKVFFLLLSGTWCLGFRVNHRRFAWPDDNTILFPGSHPSHSHSPAIHPPHSPTASERLHLPVFPRSDPSPKPVPAPKPVTTPKPITTPIPIPTLKPACAQNLECDHPCENDANYNDTIRARIDTLINESGGTNIILKSPIFQALLEEVKTDEMEGPSIRSGIIETPVCAGEETIFFPERAKTVNEDWAFVLNQGDIKQGIKFEKCISNGTKCNLGSAGSEVDTVCRQKYIYKKMLVMDGQGSKILPESVLMPSCCVCYMRESFRGHFGRVGSRPRRDGCL